MSWIRIFDFLDINIFSNFASSREKRDRRNSEIEALTFVHTQRMRRAEIRNLKEQLTALDELKKQPESDPNSIKSIEDELSLKERLLTTGTFSIERNQYNASILDAFTKECEDLQRIEGLKEEIKKLESEGKMDDVDRIQNEINERERWLDKNVLEKLWPTQE